MGGISLVRCIFYSISSPVMVCILTLDDSAFQVKKALVRKRSEEIVSKLLDSFGSLVMDCFLLTSHFDCTAEGYLPIALRHVHVTHT